MPVITKENFHFFPSSSMQGESAGMETWEDIERGEDREEERGERCAGDGAGMGQVFWVRSFENSSCGVPFQ